MIPAPFQGSQRPGSRQFRAEHESCPSEHRSDSCTCSYLPWTPLQICRPTSPYFPSLSHQMGSWHSFLVRRLLSSSTTTLKTGDYRSGLTPCMSKPDTPGQYGRLWCSRPLSLGYREVGSKVSLNQTRTGLKDEGRCCMTSQPHVRSFYPSNAILSCPHTIQGTSVDPLMFHRPMDGAYHFFPTMRTLYPGCLVTALQHFS